MKKVLLLTKVFLKNSFNTNTDSKKKVGNFLVYAFLVMYMFGVVGALSYDIIKSLISAGMEEIGILIIMGLALIFTGVQSILVSMNVFYFSKENENILPFPINPKQLILAKIFQMLIIEDIMVLIIGIPFLVLYMMLCDLGILFLIRSIFLISIISIISICFITFIMMILTSINKKMRNKDIMQVLNIFLVFIVLFFTMKLSGVEENLLAENMKSFLQNNEIISKITNDMPFLFRSVIDFCEGNKPITNLGIILSVLIAVLFIFVNISKGIYINTLTKINTSSTSNNVNSKKELKYKKQNIGMAYVKKEFKILFRNPIFFIQCVLPIVVLPLIMIIPITMEMDIDFCQIRNTFSVLEMNIDPFLVCTALIGFQLLSIFVYIAVTAFSRDGVNAVFSKYIPISFEKQITYKVLPNIILCAIWPLIIGVGIKILIHTMNIWIILLAIVATLIINSIFAYLDILIDLAKPKLIWETEYAVVKNNMNMLLQSIFQSFGIVILALLTMLITKFVKDTIKYLLVLNIVLVLVYMLVKLYIKKNQMKLMKKIC